uniref:Radical SAM protein n=1 Tax=candidate division WOR-3 bacterium TaxID=2052148 RepID=A0A7V4E2U7_UNCW3
MNTPYLIDWAVTNKCNLNCLHCRGMANEELNKENILKIAKEISALSPRWIIIEGGEPLLKKELLKIIEIIFESNIKTYLITNGMFFNENWAKIFKKFNINLMISVDGADKESYEKIRKGASFEKLKEAVTIANEYNILDSALITIGKHNKNQIAKLFQFIKEIGFKKITFLGLKPCKDYEKYLLDRKEYKELLFTIIENQKKTEIDVYVDEPFFKAFLKEYKIEYFPNSQNGIIVPDTSACIFGEYIFIDTNGDVKPCTFAPITIGNVKEKSLRVIWEDMKNSLFIKEIKNLKRKKNPCRECKYLYECGGCLSRIFYLTKDFSNPDPCCPLI